MSIQVNVMANGRLSLPADLRRRLGLSDGGTLLIDETDDGLVMRTVDQAVAHAQALARHYTAESSEASVEAFLANRRRDSGE